MAGQNRCIDLALEGERRCRAGDTKTGITYLEAALAEGTDDLRTLSAIYSQLGNGYFYLGDYMKALEYHRHDLTLARTIGDTLGEAKASGNLGNTLKVLGKFEEAVVCCQRHLEISRNLKDKVGEARALYNLGNVYHAKGKHFGRLSCTPGANDNSGAEFPQEVKSSLKKAVEFYEANLAVVQELGDKAAKGRACGNLGNTYYLLGLFEEAVQYHQLRLNLAKEFGDKAAMRRAYSNLGNAHVFLGDFEKALDYYKKALSVAIEMCDQATEAQACYSLGNTSTLMGNYDQAVDYHIRHLGIARALKDRVGESRACWSLGNAFSSLGDHSKARYFVLLHFHLSQEIGDLNGESAAERNLSDLGHILGEEVIPDSSSDPTPISLEELSEITKRTVNNVGIRMRRNSMEKMEKWRLTPTSSNNQTSRSKYAEKPRDLPISGNKNKDVLEVSQIRPQFTGNTPEDDMCDEDSFLELLCRVQERRIDDQRCDPRTLSEQNKENRPRCTDSLKPARRRLSIGRIFGLGSSAFRPGITSTPALRTSLSVRQNTTKSNKKSVLHRRLSLGSKKANDTARTIPRIEQSPDEFLEMVVGIQGRRMDDQRADLDFLPGLQDPQRVLGPHLEKRKRSSQDSTNTQNTKGTTASGQAQGTDKQLDDDFVDMLMKCQSTRIDEQRSELPKKPPTAPTVPEDDFFQLIMKMQSGRFDDQRTALAPSPGANTKKKTHDLPPSSSMNEKSKSSQKKTQKMNGLAEN